MFSFSDSANTIQAGVQSTSETTTHTNQDIDDLYVLIDSLDPHLRPATPDYSDPQSVAVYEEHKELAKEYWKVSSRSCHSFTPYILKFIIKNLHI